MAKLRFQSLILIGLCCGLSAPVQSATQPPSPAAIAPSANTSPQNAPPALINPANPASRKDLLPLVLGVNELQVSNDYSGLALDGFDPVSYFLFKAPKAGDGTFEVIWNNAPWRFSSAANRAAFIDQPELYAPRFGGYDAEMIAQGFMVRADPLFFIIQGGRLYLFRTDANRTLFLNNKQRAAAAESRWKALSASLQH
jgi:hypothetical protein